MACLQSEKTQLVFSILSLRNELADLQAKIAPERCASICEKLDALRDKARADGDKDATNDSIEFALLCCRNAELRRLVEKK